MDDSSQGDICRVCRCEGQPDRQLFHPCICTGSIKWIHQDCLMQWMRYSRKEYCELCGHRFSFTPIYSPDMPRVLPLRDVAGGLLASVGTAVRNWLHYTLVAIAWLGIVPLTAYRTYKFLFSGSLDMILSFDFFSTEHILSDVLRGCVVITCSLLAFIALVWLREQVLHGGGPDWLEREEVNPQPAPAPPAPVPEVADRVIEDNGRNALRNRARGDVPDAPEQVIEDNGRNGFRNQPNDAQGDVIADNVGNALNNQPFRNREREVQNNLPDVIENNIRDEDNLNNDPVIDRDPILERDLIPDDPDPIGEREEPDGEQEAAGENWNPMEWDRGAEELTWERLLGLDGSMVFLEHVFWVVSLNTVFIFIFAFCPYVIGNSLLKYTNYLEEKSLIHFDGILTALFGYCIIAVTFVKLHGIARLLRFKKLKRIFGLCYIYVKVSLLAVVEIGVIPLVCGWWLDICSLPMFDATLKDRKESFKAAPGTSLFIHWMFGMVYVYYFASFIVVLREVLRPGVLWFLRNLNDPDFSPIQEMIHLSILTHVRRLLVSAVIFGTAVLLGIWVPIQILQTIWPSFLPYTLSADSDINEQSLHLLLFQFVLPGFFEQSHSRIWLKGLIRLWCTVVSWILGIKSYLLGLNEQQNVNNARAPEPQQGLGAAHQALLQREVPIGFQPYTKPKFFPIRIFFLIILMSMSLVVASVITLTVPIWIGRQSMTVWSFSSHVVQPTKPDEQPLRPHELYTAALGTYMCWLILRAIMIAANLIPLGRQAIVTKLKQWYTVGASYAMAVVISVLMLGVVPLLFGLLLELVVVIPLRVPLMQTPILFLWQDWALGVLYTKIACALTLMGPDWSLKRAIERAYRDGLRDIDLKFIVRELCAPVIICFGLMLAIPYVIAHTIVPLFITNPTIIAYISRRIYPFFLLIALGTVFLIFQVKQFSKFYIAIKNDKYLVGQRLVNYDHRKKRAEAQAAAAAALAAEADRDN